jgi:hypothetical protein
MYEQQYEGGKFYARILNKFYENIEELFLDPRFSKIANIKTIGAPYVAASDLQSDSNDENPFGRIISLLFKKIFK